MWTKDLAFEDTGADEGGRGFKRVRGQGWGVYMCVYVGTVAGGMVHRVQEGGDRGGDVLLFCSWLLSNRD